MNIELQIAEENGVIKVSVLAPEGQHVEVATLNALNAKEEKKKINNIADAMTIHSSSSPAGTAGDKKATPAATNRPRSTAEETKPAPPATETTNKGRMIPINELPEPCQRILQAWNQLPLKEMAGLYPSLLKKLQHLLHIYGEEALHTAIANIGESPFLLGRSPNSNGWKIHFHWMLEPEHFEKILEGQYEDLHKPEPGHEHSNVAGLAWPNASAYFYESEED